MFRACVLTAALARDALSLLAGDEPLDGSVVLARRALPASAWAIGENETLAFLHVPKAAGTSFRHWMLKARRKLFLPVRDEHFDMSYLDNATRGWREPPRLLALLREPGARSASNLLYWKYRELRRGHALTDTKHERLSAILRSESLLEKYRNAVADGLGGVCWLAGLCPSNPPWIKTCPTDDEERRRRREVFEVAPMRALEEAVQGLERLSWLGLYEDRGRSLQLLAWQLGLKSTPKFALDNKNWFARRRASETDLVLLQALAPLDVALYAYARRLFELRWAAYQKFPKGTTATQAGDMPHGDASAWSAAMDALARVSSKSYLFG